jgi:mycofactocin biosynthetic radical S-adenosylmethionine protein MftC
MPLERIAADYGAQLRITRLRPSGRGASVWDELHPTATQQRELYEWLIERPDVLTGDSFFHLSALGEPLPGLNLCGAGPGGVPGRPGRRRVCLPVRAARRVPRR